jgi:hypothetical protein
VLADALDHAVQARLEEMLDRDFDKVVDLCMEQAATWRAQSAAHMTDRQATERRVAELETIVARLNDAIEAGQPVGDRLKTRQQELDTLRGKLEEPEPLPDRRQVMNLLKPLGPLVGLGVSDPATVRGLLRKLGIERVIVAPDGQGGWTFKGAGDFSGLILGNGHRRSKAAPSDTSPVRAAPLHSVTTRAAATGSSTRVGLIGEGGTPPPTPPRFARRPSTPLRLAPRPRDRLLALV